MWFDIKAEIKDRIAITDASDSVTYKELYNEATTIAHFLLEKFNTNHLEEIKIAFLVNPSIQYVAIEWGIWLAGGVAVPLCNTHPISEINYVLEDANCQLLLSEELFQDVLKEAIIKPVYLKSITIEETHLLPLIQPEQRALIIYTSGTTGKPKGVVSTHQNIESQIKTLVKAWEWTATDKILHILPLHHIHGIINALCCALYVGAEVHFLSKFEANKVWDWWQKKDFTIFMAVPTVYSRLITEWENSPQDVQQNMTAACKKMRLMISGSAALPVSILERWEVISGHFLLERYGMSEIGMAISNPLHGKRKAGFIGLPLPNVDVRLVNEQNNIVNQGDIGEIQVKGDNVFLEYWNKKQATLESFTEDGWFKTGDTAIQDEEGYFKILGRTSIDIIKTGGYKVSAIEIEETLRLHPSIKDCAVVGIADEEWGEKVSVCLILHENQDLSLENLRIWAKTQIAHYKIPTQIKILTELPRNAMGKVIKPELKKLFLL
ncbi:MAG: acyl-CoA synthetase [Raineya sp.]|jgi:malonyl-CoA/methylmalonyl-CoA synthetase|nr:acyl-CoA synthetase [Raineya sp.]